MPLSRLFRREPPPRIATTLYTAVVARGRMPHWYLAGGVPDTLDGRFDMIAAVLSMVMLRLEGEGAGAAPAASLAECFVDDMDGQLRQIGFGDMVVGKHIGRMMAALGGRLGAYRDGLSDGGFESALVRNLYRGVEPAPDALAHVAAELRALRVALDTVSIDDLLAGTLP
ncbi:MULTISPECIES: ubiquinol-cytochrome C chaperone family protein [unclassified Sphingomonas]|uniref:ubiquinol-cytochrome C chaperone family protein n=1 Tax=unclassified Sphingomonas TaxID=196159 RepID=UPI0006F5616C|nr:MULTISPECIES: ubiquinol-cytochrome C chaperone family protein [unclassified Sphingomonas]KQM26625.1 ubiquinol-cytochrome C chaperone [Sphingomonas sp. Leaf9]KQM43031.1 ubiquinol-cytochrome C chaperone [Sphingomonas sp. Leaf11]